MKKSIAFLAASLCLVGALALNSFGQEPQPRINTTVGVTASSYQIPSDRYDIGDVLPFLVRRPG